jgi:paraquat-inducible protein B
MSKKPNPTAIGAFVVGAMVMIVVGVVVLGSINLFAPTRKFTIFFEGSVQGLQVGSPVKAQGVEVGKVTEIRAVADEATWTIQTETIVEVDPSKLVGRGLGYARTQPARELVDNGLRARLETASVLTGQLYVSIDFLPDTPARLLGESVRYPQIPALPTRFQEAENTLRKIAEKLREVPLDELVDNMNSVLTGIDSFVNGGRLDSLAAGFEETMGETRATIAEVRSVVSKLDGNVDPLVGSITSAMNEAEKALGGISAATQPGGPLLYQTQATLEELQQAARALRLLATLLERKPNAVVFGRDSEED